MINAPIKGAIGYIIALLTSVATPPFDTLNVRELPTLSAAFAAPANLRLALFTILNPLVPVFVMITIFVLPELLIVVSPKEDATDTETASHVVISIVDVAPVMDSVFITVSVRMPLPARIFSVVLLR